MTTEQLYQPITNIFSTEELTILPKLCQSLAKKEEEYARKANDAERAVDEETIAEHLDQAQWLSELADKISSDDMIVEDMKEEWIGEALLKEIHTRQSLCKREKFEFYNVLANKIIDLIY